MFRHILRVYTRETNKREYLLVKSSNPIKPSTHSPPRRLQQRGQRRINQLLDAADALFAEIGYERATTNAISQSAGVSPGTFYQFFPNKQAVAEALAERYVKLLPEIHRTAFDVAAVNGPLSDLIEHVVDPFVELHRQGSCLEALLSGSVISDELSLSIKALDQHVEVGLENLFVSRCPRGNRTELKRAATTCVQLFKALLRSALNGTTKQQKQGIQELKTVLYRYLEPILGK
jgi:AcrR family transcriptional regulator